MKSRFTAKKATRTMSRGRERIDGGSSAPTRGSVSSGPRVMRVLRVRAWVACQESLSFRRAARWSQDRRAVCTVERPPDEVTGHAHHRLFEKDHPRVSELR